MENQVEAIKINLFSLIGQLISETDHNFFNHNTIQFLAELKLAISSSNQKLLDQVNNLLKNSIIYFFFLKLFTDLLWNMALIENCTDLNSVVKYYKKFFHINFRRSISNF
jgi:hypothetical protein